MDEGAFQDIILALRDGSRTLAVAELISLMTCEKLEAEVWIEHLLSCVYAWPLPEEDGVILTSIEQAFSGISRPDHFTNFTHCDECQEHDDTLRARTCDTLQRKDLGNMGWGPLSFCSEEGMGYYFPVLVRIALLPDAWRDHDWFLGMFLWHLSYEGNSNRFLCWCSPNQRETVYGFLRHCATTRMETLAYNSSDDELHAALAAWEPSIPN